VTKSKQCSI